MARRKTTSTIGERSKRQRAPQQMDLFGEVGTEAHDGRPAWPDLPDEARITLVGLMTRLMLDHAPRQAVIAAVAGALALGGGRELDGSDSTKAPFLRCRRASPRSIRSCCPPSQSSAA